MADVTMYVTNEVQQDRMLKWAYHDLDRGKTVALHYHNSGDPCNERCNLDFQKEPLD